jgi:hypothetical protein
MGTIGACINQVFCLINRGLSMLKIAPIAAFVAPVKLNVPNEAGGFDEVKFKAKFKGLGRQAYKDLMAHANAGEDGDRLVVGEVMIGWEGVGNEAGEPLPFTPDNLATLLDAYPGAVNQISGTFVRTLLGAKSGN